MPHLLLVTQTVLRFNRLHSSKLQQLCSEMHARFRKLALPALCFQCLEQERNGLKTVGIARQQEWIYLHRAFRRLASKVTVPMGEY